jgi:glycosyltransferase involved in cell wall biosynthesis
MSQEKIKISVIMPALNEEANIAGAINGTIESFDALGLDAEIVAVNDGSCDATQSIMEKKALEFPGRIRIINHAKPQGIGASFWQGVDEARGSIVVMLPGDNENDSTETLRYSGLLEHVDIVIPFIFNKQARSLFRNALSFLYRFIINTTFLVNFNYTNGTILYRRSILKECPTRSDSFFFQTDILIRAVKRGYLFAEVPYRLGVRKAGVSKAISFPSLWKVMKGYARLVKDLYFTKNKNHDVLFTKDSQTALRKNQGCS